MAVVEVLLQAQRVLAEGHVKAISAARAEVAGLTVVVVGVEQRVTSAMVVRVARVAVARAPMVPLPLLMLGEPVGEPVVLVAQVLATAATALRVW